MKEIFRKLARHVADWTGTATAFILAGLTILIWAVTGPMFHYSENWQLVINTSTTIITFLMVFLIQNSQNRDSQMIHLKLDELIRATKSARNMMIDLDRRSDEELAAMHTELCALKEETNRRIRSVSAKRTAKALADTSGQ